MIGTQSGTATGSGDDGLAFIGIHKPRGFENLWLRFGLNDDETVLISMYQIPRTYLATKNLDLAVPPHRMNMRMTHTKAASERLEASVGHFINIANRSVHDGAHTAK